MNQIASKVIIILNEFSSLSSLFLAHPQKAVRTNYELDNILISGDRYGLRSQSITASKPKYPKALLDLVSFLPLIACHVN